MMVEIAMGGMSMMKQVVGDKTGYQSQQGQKKAIEGEEFTKMKAESVPFPELTLANKPGVTLTSIEPINGSDAYTVVDGDNTMYFDVKSGLKTAETRAQDQGGKKVNMTTYYKDYRDVKGVKIPYNPIMNVGIELDVKITDVKINEGVTDADFQ
jgi:hypothetical protein